MRVIEVAVLSTYREERRVEETGDRRTRGRERGRLSTRDSGLV